MIVRILPPIKFWGRTHYELQEDFEILSHTIPKGFISDGATTPRILWSIFPPVSKYVSAAFLHDYLLKKGHNGYAHDEFYKALKILGVNQFRAWIMYRSVQVYWDVKELIR